MSYITVARAAQVELVVKKSRFIAQVQPVKNEGEAWEFIRQVGIQHKEASHNVFAFKAGEVQRLSDDGEPSGTAGRPVFEVIEKQGLSDLVVVVTRYFGGILLGVGGLVRAYSQAAAAGIEAAGRAEGAEAIDLEIRLEYALVGRVQYLLQQRGGIQLDRLFGRDVLLRCRLLASEAEGFEGDLKEASAGRIQIERLGVLQVGADLHPL